VERPRAKFNYILENNTEIRTLNITGIWSTCIWLQIWSSLVSCDHN